MVCEYAFGRSADVAFPTFRVPLAGGGRPHMIFAHCNDAFPPLGGLSFRYQASGLIPLARAGSAVAFFRDRHRESHRQAKRRRVGAEGAEIAFDDFKARVGHSRQRAERAVGDCDDRGLFLSRRFDLGDGERCVGGKADGDQRVVCPGARQLFRSEAADIVDQDRADAELGERVGEIMRNAERAALARRDRSCARGRASAIASSSSSR